MIPQQEHHTTAKPQEKRNQKHKDEDPPRSLPETKSHLQTLSNSFVEAINTRDFTPSSPIWSSLATSFRASPHPPNPPLNIPRVEWLEWMEQLYESNPEWKMRCTGSDVVIEGEEEFAKGEERWGGRGYGMAEVFMNLETSGIPPGIVTRSCAVVKFREMKTGWRCTGFLGVNGGPGLEGEGGLW